MFADRQVAVLRSRPSDSRKASQRKDREAPGMHKGLRRTGKQKNVPQLA